MSHDDVEIEPIPGLPEMLPEGESILWQGSPSWRRLALDHFALRWLTLYFAALVIARGVFASVDGATVQGALWASVEVMPLALLAVGLIGGFAWLCARTSMYTITNRRVVMRVGVAFPITFNLPFTRVAAANLRRRGSESGDISVALAGQTKLKYAHLWPHTRAFRLKRAEPTMLALPNVEAVAQVLTQAAQGARA